MRKMPLWQEFRSLLSGRKRQTASQVITKNGLHSNIRNVRMTFLKYVLIFTQITQRTCVCVCVCVYIYIYPLVQTGPGAHLASCRMGTGSFPRVKCGRGVLLNTHPLLVPRSWKSRAVPLPTLWATPDL